MPKISIITPTVRDAGLPLVEKALKRQTFQDFEWIVQKPQGEKPKGLFWTLYRDYNQAVRRSRGELLVSWQDYTYTRPDTLERLWFHHQNEPKTIVGVVGNKYADDSWRVKTWQDPREKGDGFNEVAPVEIEYNLCALPKEAVYAVGGFDEEMDKYSSVCGLDVSVRLEILGGYKFKLDQSIKTFSTEHGRLPSWEENEPFNGPWQKRLEEYKKNPVLSYLKKDRQNK